MTPQPQDTLDLRAEAVRIAYKAVPLRSGCSNCWGDLGQGCTDECRQSSARHSEKIDETVEAILALITHHCHKKVLEGKIKELRKVNPIASHELAATVADRMERLEAELNTIREQHE